jgi:hypothetical protein
MLWLLAGGRLVAVPISPLIEQHGGPPKCDHDERRDDKSENPKLVHGLSLLSARLAAKCKAIDAPSQPTRPSTSSRIPINERKPLTS